MSTLPAETRTTHLYALLPHPTQPAVLGVSVMGQVCLPQTSVTGQIDQTRIDWVRAALGPICGLPLNVLRCLAFEISQQEQRTDALYLLEAREDAFLAGIMPERLNWINLENLNLSLVPEVLWIPLSRWLEERKLRAPGSAARQQPDGMAPWSLPGWYAQAETWIAVEMAQHGIRIQAIEPLRSWCISAVLRVDTINHPVFFKASLDLPLFVNEGVVMAGLAELYPDWVPAPLAVNAAQHWMLLEDLGEPIGRNAPLELKVRLFQTMARIQTDSSGRIDNLIQMGCIDRRIPWLQAHLDALLVDEITLSQLTYAEREELRSALPRLQSLLAELDSLSIPPALIHGDFHTGNVTMRDGKIQIFDWTDAAISHPFFDLDVVFNEKDPAWRKTLEEAYLSVWEQVCPANQVRRAFELARVVYGLYHAVSYQFILNNLDEADREEINTAHYFFRRVLAGLKLAR